MHFLITNDDGFDAPGLAALYNALTPLGTVTVVAPSVCHSSKGHAVNTYSELVIEHKTVEPFGDIHVAHASPADCVRIGLRALDLPPPDFVVAGINPGANLGVDLFYSGTAAAAREAAIMGIPSIAVSRYIQQGMEINWNGLTEQVTWMIEQLTSDDWRLPSGQFWNVNFPSAENDSHERDFIVAPMGLLSHNIGFRTIESAGGRTVIQYHADYRSRGMTGSCDVSHVLKNQIAVTPVDLCNTAGHAKLARPD